MSETSTRIALTMLEYMQPTEWPSSPAMWWLWPDPRPLRHGELHAALEAMPKPVTIGALVERGCLAVWPIAETVPEVRVRLEHRCRNQLNYLREKLQHFDVGPRPVSILLELEADALVFSSDELEAWAQEYYVITSGWTLSRSGDDPRAPIRLLLRRPDGRWSPGDACQYRPRAA